jgi:RNA polymerase sigma-70 factor (ECF subfamily)
MQPIELDEDAIEIIEAASLAPAVELLDDLTPEQREAIVAHHLDERGYAEIAADLRCSESVIRKRVSRGLAALHAQLDEGRTA